MGSAGGKFGSFANLGLWTGVSGFANVPNVDWQRNFEKCEAGEIEIFPFSVE